MAPNRPTSAVLTFPQFELVKKAITSVYPDFKVIAPYLMVAATDSRVYHGMSEAVYRVEPFASSKEDRSTVHADNERLSIDSFQKGIELFKVILKEGTKV